MNQANAKVCTRTPIVVATLILTCSTAADNSGYTVIREMPHDTGAYTQGLVYAGGVLYESTGRYGLSELRRVDLLTGRIQVSHALGADRFGEGLTLLDGRLYQLTWKSGVGYVYDAESLAPLDSFRYDGEGWGLATDGEALIMSDGTAMLRFLDPRGFQVLREVEVQDRGLPLSQLNELEYVDGRLFANIYQSDRVVTIDPGSGEVLDWLDLAGLLSRERRPAGADVLNGIALDPATGHLFVTGKLWPLVFEIRLDR